MARNRKEGKRNFDPISLSFLDVISCGFGAVVLIFLILDHSSNPDTATITPELRAEINLLEEEILEGQDNLVRVRNTLSDVDLRMVEAQGLARVIQDQIESIMEQLAQIENESESSDRTVERLRAEIAALQAELQRLEEAERVAGNNVRRFVGDGNRQYLTGLILGGNRILILVDVSASMLDSTIVNIIRRRNMDDDAKRASDKWVRTRRTVEWLISQLPIPSQYQIYTFSTGTRSLIEGTEGQWLEVADREQLDRAVAELERTVPHDGTNLEQLFRQVAALNPRPDNIYLITDGLPTIDSRTSASQRTVSGRDRERIFDRAIGELPKGIPVNIILMPLEGDPAAASLYWKLAIASKGSFLNPSEDWP